MDWNEVTQAPDAASIVEQAQEAERARQAGPGILEACADLAFQMLAQTASIPWECLRLVGRVIVGTFEVAGEIVAAIFEGLLGGL